MESRLMQEVIFFRLSYSSDRQAGILQLFVCSICRLVIELTR